MALCCNAFAIRWVSSSSGAVTEQRLTLPVGVLRLVRQGEVVIGSDWDGETAASAVATHEAVEWLGAGGNQPLTLLQQGSTYRQRVWAELLAIPYAETLTYAALAKNIGSAARAVGNACRDNPYALIIPCHRVVAAHGMGGYCGATDGNYLQIKRRLLAWEAQQLQPAP
jgi:methylated-DNA-[protein]-cysteine S-methyltransferase